MGLAAPKNRSRISNDPQNTTWANNTSRFGHRILTSHGWTPGASLGATDAAHAAHYTAASSSHIRVLLKDDNLGLGAKRGSERPENFGLAGLASILGRLNGNEADVKKEEERQEKIEQKAYVYRKYGFMNFVSAGYLVGGEIQKGVKPEVDAVVKVEIKEEPVEERSEVTAKKEKKDKKRKRSSEDEEAKVDGAEEQPKLKRKRKSISLREEAAKEDEAEDSTSKPKKDKKDKKEKKSSSDNTSAADSPAPSSDLTDAKARRKAEKAERRARKEEKRLSKALKKAAKEAAQSNPTTNDTSSESEEEAGDSPPLSTSVTASAVTTGTSTPTTTGLTFSAGGRHAVRQKYIRQKRMAGMDPQALKEIFMIKTPS